VSDPTNYPWLRTQLDQFRSLLQRSTSRWEKTKQFEKITGDLEAMHLRGEVEGQTKDDAKFDFFRLVQVSDSTTLPPSALQIQLTQSLGTTRYTRTWIETIAPGSEISVQTSLGDSTLLVKELGLERLRGWLTLPKLLEACFRRSKDILEEEARHLADQPRLQALLIDLRRMNTPDAPLLRLGQGQGFLGVTVMLSVRQRDERLYDQAVREGVSLQRRWRTQTGFFPKTRRIITDRTGAPVS